MEIENLAGLEGNAIKDGRRSFRQRDERVLIPRRQLKPAMGAVALRPGLPGVVDLFLRGSDEVPPDAARAA
jgi:hypothetical protein